MCVVSFVFALVLFVKKVFVGLLFIGCWLMVVARWLLAGVCCVLFVVCYVLYDVGCLFLDC